MNLMIWLMVCSPIIALSVNVLVQIITVHVGWKISRSIIMGIIAGLLADGLLLNFISQQIYLGESTYISMLTYLCLSFCFWAFLNLNITSVRIRVAKELLSAGEGLNSTILLQRYSEDELLARRLQRLQQGGQIMQLDGCWYLKSYQLLVFVYVSLFLRKLIMAR